MTCPNDGTLRAALDGALNAAEQKAVESHWEGCAECGGRRAELHRLGEQVDAQLTALDSGMPPAPARVALAQFRQHAAGLEEKSILGRWRALRLHPGWSGAVGALAVAAVFLAFPAARSWAQGLLNQLRIERVAVLSFDPAAVPELEGRTAKAMAALFSDQVVTDVDPGEPVEVKDAAEAGKRTGFGVHTLTGFAQAPKVSVRGAAAYRLTLDQDKLQALLDETGRKDIVLPRAVDGATLAVRVPAGVISTYGNCPDREECVVLVEGPSPQLDVPPELNIQELAEAAMQFGGMSADAARSFAQTVDWQSTLVVPIPRDSASAETVEVDGVSATLIRTSGFGRRHHDAKGFSLIWVKGGIVHGIFGHGTAEAALALAKRLD
jgi:anti-sigma factor RsiW